MSENSWAFFPAVLVRKINQLLHSATPNPQKAFQLYKMCQRENLYSGGFETFTVHLKGYFLQNFHERAKSHLDSFLNRPLDRHLYDHFSLTFRTGVVSAGKAMDISHWSSRMIRENLKTDSTVVSTEVLARAVDLVTHPPAHEKEHSIEFEDFCIAWKKIVFTLFGHAFDSDVQKILQELRRLNRALKSNRESELQPAFRPSIYLTQTEIDWTENIQQRLLSSQRLPDFPLSRGPQKDKLIELEKAARLYNIMQRTNLPALTQHRDDLKATILTHCQWLLTEKAR